MNKLVMHLTGVHCKKENMQMSFLPVRLPLIITTQWLNGMNRI